MGYVGKSKVKTFFVQGFREWKGFCDRSSWVLGSTTLKNIVMARVKAAIFSSCGKSQNFEKLELETWTNVLFWGYVQRNKDLDLILTLSMNRCCLNPFNFYRQNWGDLSREGRILTDLLWSLIPQPLVKEGPGAQTADPDRSEIRKHERACVLAKGAWKFETVCLWENSLFSTLCMFCHVKAIVIRFGVTHIVHYGWILWDGRTQEWKARVVGCERQAQQGVSPLTKS